MYQTEQSMMPWVFQTEGFDERDTYIEITKGFDLCHGKGGMQNAPGFHPKYSVNYKVAYIITTLAKRNVCLFHLPQKYGFPSN